MGARDILTGAAVGAGVAYFLDPEHGPGRRRRIGQWLARGRNSRSRGAQYGTRRGDLAGLESANLPASTTPGVGPVALAALGGALTLYGMSRSGGRAAAARTLGAGLLARHPRRAPAVAGPERRRVVDIQKSIHIAAPVADVFGFWDSYESFPLFLSSVREVEDLGGGRSRWLVRGPAGAPIEWATSLTERQPGRLIAWRSEPGSMLAHAGAIRFTPERGGTRVDLRLCYQPPAGVASRAVTALLGVDPRARLNEDLEQLKAVLEGPARRETHGQEPRS